VTAKNKTERIIEMAQDMADHTHKALREQLEGEDIGNERVSDEEFFVWYAQMTGRIPAPLDEAGQPAMQVYPPAVYLIGGQPVMVSPWELALQMVEGGKELTDRYQRALVKIATSASQEELEVARGTY